MAFALMRLSEKRPPQIPCSERWRRAKLQEDDAGEPHLDASVELISQAQTIRACDGAGDPAILG
jgi:hypothetical protein